MTLHYTDLRQSKRTLPGLYSALGLHGLSAGICARMPLLSALSIHGRTL